MRRAATFLATLLVATLVVLPASAQTTLDVDLDEIAAGLRADGYWVQPGGRFDTSGAGSALDAAENVIYVIVLAGNPDIDPGFFAEDVADRFASGTFMTLTDEMIGAYSIEFDQVTVEDALDAFADASSDAAGIRAFDAVLSGRSPGSGGSGSGTGGGFPIGTILLVVVAGGFVWMIMRSSKRSKDVATNRLEEARGQLTGLAGEVANDIIELNDVVAELGDPAATEHYREANRIFSEAEAAIAAATTEMELADLSRQLTEAEWRMEAVEAIRDGRPIPEQPVDRPVECFFHATKAGVEEAAIETPAGTKRVSVCRECAERLRKGEAPAERMIQVGGQRVPAGMAPKSYGGGGMAPMDMFSILLAGSTIRRSHSWGTPARRRSSWGGSMLGGSGFGGTTGRGSYGGSGGRSYTRSTSSRSSRSSSTRSSSSRSSSRSSSSRSSGRSSGGGRASRRR